MGISPLRMGAEDEVKPLPSQPGLLLNRFPAMGESEVARKAAEANGPRLRKRTAAEWAKLRHQTTRQRANAIAHVKRSRRIPNITYPQIQEIYDAKKAALAKVVAEGSYRRTLIAQAKARALAEVKAMVAALRDRHAAEQRALAVAAASLRATNPNYDDDALRQAMAEAQQQGGARVEALEGLPVLPNATAMNYPEGGKGVIAKNTAEPANTPGEQAQLEALRDYKKKLALESVKQARLSTELRQQKISHREMENKLNALLDQFSANQITTKEYYERREQIYRDGGIK